MLLSAAEAQKDYSFDYGQIPTPRPATVKACAPCSTPLSREITSRCGFTVLGSFSYDTQIGGNTTVPAFQVWQAELLPAEEY